MSIPETPVHIQPSVEDLLELAGKVALVCSILQIFRESQMYQRIFVFRRIFTVSNMGYDSYNFT
jgi:hypothetical protein